MTKRETQLREYVAEKVYGESGDRLTAAEQQALKRAAVYAEESLDGQAANVLRALLERLK